MTLGKGNGASGMVKYGVARTPQKCRHWLSSSRPGDSPPATKEKPERREKESLGATYPVCQAGPTAHTHAPFLLSLPKPLIPIPSLVHRAYLLSRSRSQNSPSSEILRLPIAIGCIGWRTGQEGSGNNLPSQLLPSNLLRNPLPLSSLPSPLPGLHDGCRFCFEPTNDRQPVLQR